MLKTILIAIFSRFFLMVVANTNLDYITVCDGLRCGKDEQCLIRKFWCDYNACPQMVYCSKSRKESLRGPETCKSVVCPSGYECIVHFNGCTWGETCQQRFARCVLQVEANDEPQTCMNYNCERGQHCILIEQHYCPKPPCRLMRICAQARDVSHWFVKCRQLGCHSEFECFLRKPAEECEASSCSPTPECLAPLDTFDTASNKLCHGWVCPPNYGCSARLPGSCNTPGIHCPITRSCDRHLAGIEQMEAGLTSLTDIERDIFFDEQRRLNVPRKSVFDSNLTEAGFQRYFDDVVARNGQPQNNFGSSLSSFAKTNRVSSSPIMRSVPEYGRDSAWLTYLKRRAGSDAVHYWIEKAKRNQDYEGFVEWLDSVQHLLDPDTYRLWLMEVESASANVPEFQAWISLRNLAAHRLTAAPTDTLRTYPVSIAERDKDSFYEGKDQAFYDQRQQAKSGGLIRQTANFGFNETQPLEGSPRMHPEISLLPQGPMGVGYKLPKDFEEALKSSWKAWQSYYQFHPPKTSELSEKTANAHIGNNNIKLRTDNESTPKMFFVDHRFAKTSKLNDDKMTPRSASTMSGQVTGLGEFQPNMGKLYFNQSTSPFMVPTSGDSQHQPHLLIYFPPPMNLYIYYTVGSNNETTPAPVFDEIHVETTTKKSHNFVPEDYDEKPCGPKPSPMDKQKEFEFIRKIIRELINYWDDEELLVGQSEKSADDNVGARMGSFEEVQSRTASTHDLSDNKNPNDSEGNTNFNAFLKWLLKNGHINSTQFSNLISNRPIQQELEKQIIDSPNPRNSESIEDQTSEKIRILLDVDKNAEILKKLFSKDGTKNSNGSDSQQRQVVLNLNEYMDPQEEDLISKKLINIASKQLHQNATGDQKMPKVLWVFPVYEKEGNETMMNEMKIRSREKVNTLKDVDFPTRYTDDKDDSQNPSKNSGANQEINNREPVKNEDTYGVSSSDDTGEYYDDHDVYDENDYEQSDFDEPVEIGSTKN